MQVEAAPALRMAGLTKTYDGVAVVDRLDLTVAPGEIVSLVGPSGCGKTTTLRLVAGLERTDAGTIEMDGRPVSGQRVHVPTEERGIGLMFQDFALFPHMSVADNVAFGLSALGRDERRRRALAALEEVGLARYADSYPHILSGGQQQRVALARALAPRPRLMLLDEPFSGLDTQLRGRVRRDTVHLLQATSAATLMVTHDPEEAMFMSDRIAVMRGGTIEQAGTPTEIYRSPRTAFVACFFSDVNGFKSQVASGIAATPLGAVPASGLSSGTVVDVLVRPEDVTVTSAEEPQPAGRQVAGAIGRVTLARMLGRTSLVEVRLENAPDVEPITARIVADRLPAVGSRVRVALNAARAFVFAA